MSDAQPEFDRSVRWAADCLVDAHGHAEAIQELQQRRRAGDDSGRVNEALAYLKWRGDNA